MTERLESLERVIRGELPAPPIAQLIGFRLVAVKRGEAVFDFESSERHANPMGTLHGGVLCDVADAAMGVAFASTLEDGESFTTLELKINFLRPVWSEKLRAVGRVVKRGNTVGPSSVTLPTPPVFWSRARHPLAWLCEAHKPPAAEHSTAKPSCCHTPRRRSPAQGCLIQGRTSHHRTLHVARNSFNHLNRDKFASRC